MMGDRDLRNRESRGCMHLGIANPKTPTRGLTEDIGWRSYEFWPYGIGTKVEGARIYKAVHRKIGDSSDKGFGAFRHAKP
jgi:hypothetical protein